MWHIRRTNQKYGINGDLLKSLLSSRWRHQKNHCGHVEMDGWMDGRMDGWMDGWMDGLTFGWMDDWMNGLMDGWIDDEWKTTRYHGRLISKRASDIHQNTYRCPLTPSLRHQVIYVSRSFFLASIITTMTRIIIRIMNKYNNNNIIIIIILYCNKHAHHLSFTRRGCHGCIVTSNVITASYRLTTYLKRESDRLIHETEVACEVKCFYSY